MKNCLGFSLSRDVKRNIYIKKDDVFKNHAPRVLGNKLHSKVLILNDMEIQEN